MGVLVDNKDETERGTGLKVQQNRIMNHKHETGTGEGRQFTRHHKVVC